jgi:magnesium chelatase family protein
MIVKTYCASLQGIEAVLIRVETSIENGVNFMMVGLPDNAVKESHFRIATALEHCGYRIPGKKIVINLAPADIKKEGSAYDLTIAVGILAASEQIKADKIGEYLIMGELSLDGHLQAIKGVLPIAMEARKNGFKGIILPAQNAAEAAIVEGFNVYGVTHLKELLDFFNDKNDIAFAPYSVKASSPCLEPESSIDFCDVRGQQQAKRALEIAAAGGHNVLLSGPPGSGKTLLAKRLAGILPPLEREEQVETTKIYSVAGKLPHNSSLITKRPFRAPHHTISYTALVGGGSYPLPGEISLAHNGVLFLDELPEFSRKTIEVLRQPLEERSVQISRAKMRVSYPSNFMLIASMNPCPCGYYGVAGHKCSCTPNQVLQYKSKISGPLYDRIDLKVNVAAVSYEEISDAGTLGEKSEMIRQRVIAARERQIRRFTDFGGDVCFKSAPCVGSVRAFSNSQMDCNELRKHCVLSSEGKWLMKRTMEHYMLSGRAHDRILRVARTIADLAESVDISEEHLAEAIRYRL